MNGLISDSFQWCCKNIGNNFQFWTIVLTHHRAKLEQISDVFLFVFLGDNAVSESNEGVWRGI